MVFFKLAVGSAADLDAKCCAGSSRCRAIRANIIYKELERFYAIFGVALLPSLGAAVTTTSTTRPSDHDDDEAPFHEQLTKALAQDKVSPNEITSLLTAKWSPTFLIAVLRQGANSEPSSSLSVANGVSCRGAEFVLDHRLTFLHLLVIAFHAVGSRRRGYDAPTPSSTAIGSSQKTNLTTAIPPHLKDFMAARQSIAFPEDADVLLPISLTESSQNDLIALLMAASGSVNASEALNDFLGAAKNAGAASQLATAYTTWGQLTICPRRSPPPSFAQLRKNARVAMIENVCDMRAYNNMMTKSSTDNRAEGSRGKTLQSAPPLVPAAGVAAPGKKIRVDPALAKLGLDRADIANIASVVHQPIDHRHGANTAPGRNRSGGASSESYSSFMKDLTIGIDMRLMSLAGGVVGYYVCYSRGQSVDLCLVGAAVGAVAMLLMDAVLLLIRLSKEDGHLQSTTSTRSQDAPDDRLSPKALPLPSTGSQVPQRRTKKLQ
jgi:hypothetical protein